MPFGDEEKAEILALITQAINGGKPPEDPPTDPPEDTPEATDEDFTNYFDSISNIKRIKGD